MWLRVISVVLVIGILGLGFAAWMSQREKPQASAMAGSPEQDGSAPSGGAPGATPPGESGGPGLRWNVPARWQTQGERPMRFATYSVPAAAGDPRGGECAVFYFGPGQGGDIEANIERWVGQFKFPEIGKRSKKDVHGVHVTHVEVKGTYLAPAGPNMESQGEFQHYALIGAIAEGPNGSVFFKFTGPSKTVEAARREFEGMMNSIATE